MVITIDLIKKYDPCKCGIDNFESKYPNYEDSLVNLLALEDISYSDKVWLATKVVDYKILQQWSVECAEQVVEIYNKVYPNDTRISDCIKITKEYLQGTVTSKELLTAESAAWSAAESAAESAARSAARSAAWSAAWSARSAALSARSAESAAWSAWSAVLSAAEKQQEDINLSILIALLEE